MNKNTTYCRSFLSYKLYTCNCIGISTSNLHCKGHRCWLSETQFVIWRVDCWTYML